MATANIDRPIARASGGNASHKPAHEKAKNNPSIVATAARAGHNLSQKRLPRARASARASKSLAVFSCSKGWFFGSSKRRSVAQARENLFIRLTRANPDGHACLFMRSKPIRHAIEPNEFVNLNARANHGPLRPIVHNFGHQGPGIVSAGPDCAVCARGHDRQQCVTRGFHHIAVNGEEVSAFANWPDYVGAKTS